MPKSQPQTTTQSLGSLLKSARDLMRKDKELNGELDRLPLLTWIMFLKFLDDLELQREAAAAHDRNSARMETRKRAGTTPRFIGPSSGRRGISGQSSTPRKPFNPASKNRRP